MNGLTSMKNEFEQFKKKFDAFDSEVMKQFSLSSDELLQEVASRLSLLTTETPSRRSSITLSQEERESMRRASLDKLKSDFHVFSELSTIIEMSKEFGSRQSSTGSKMDEIPSRRASRIPASPLKRKKSLRSSLTNTHSVPPISEVEDSTEENQQKEQKRKKNVSQRNILRASNSAPTYPKDDSIRKSSISVRSNISFRDKETENLNPDWNKENIDPKNTKLAEKKSLVGDTDSSQTRISSWGFFETPLKHGERISDILVPATDMSKYTTDTSSGRRTTNISMEIEETRFQSDSDVTEIYEPNEACRRHSLVEEPQSLITQVNLEKSPNQNSMTSVDSCVFDGLAALPNSKYAKTKAIKKDAPLVRKRRSSLSKNICYLEEDTVDGTAEDSSEDWRPNIRQKKKKNEKKPCRTIKTVPQTQRVVENSPSADLSVYDFMEDTKTTEKLELGKFKKLPASNEKSSKKTKNICKRTTSKSSTTTSQNIRR